MGYCVLIRILRFLARNELISEVFRFPKMRIMLDFG